MFLTNSCNVAQTDAPANNNEQPSSNNANSFDAVYKALQLTPEQINAAKQGENNSVPFMAYMEQLGLNIDETSCKAFSVDPKNIKFTLYR